MSPRTTLGMVSPILYFPAAYTQMTSSEILNLENKSYLQETKNYQKESSPIFPGRPVQAETALYIIYIWLTSEYSFRKTQVTLMTKNKISCRFQNINKPADSVTTFWLSENLMYDNFH